MVLSAKSKQKGMSVVQLLQLEPTATGKVIGHVALLQGWAGLGLPGGDEEVQKQGYDTKMRYGCMNQYTE